MSAGPKGAVNDYPRMIAPVNHIEPVPRRVRAVLGGATVLDSAHALYVWEWPNYPQYYIPVADVDPKLMVDEDRTEHLGRGTARRHGLRVDEISHPGVAHVYTNEAIEGLAGTVRFEWAALEPGLRKTSRSSSIPATHTPGSTPYAPHGMYGSASTGSC